MTKAISPSVSALLEIMGSAGPMRHRLDASETLLTFETTPEVVEIAKGFLTSVVENRGGGRTDYRLRAGALLRRAEARRIAAQSIRTAEASRWNETWRRVAAGRRRLRLDRAGLWPAPRDWCDDIMADDYVVLRPSEGLD